MYGLEKLNLKYNDLTSHIFDLLCNGVERWLKLQVRGYHYTRKQSFESTCELQELWLEGNSSHDGGETICSYLSLERHCRIRHDMECTAHPADTFWSQSMDQTAFGAEDEIQSDNAGQSIQRVLTPAQVSGFGLPRLHQMPAPDELTAAGMGVHLQGCDISPICSTTCAVVCRNVSCQRNTRVCQPGFCS